MTEETGSRERRVEREERKRSTKGNKKRFLG
jgi:hypothetical protein